MEGVMNINPVVLNIDQVVQLIDTLYNSKNTSDQAEANRRLTDLQSSDKVWDICWALLNTNRYGSLEVHFYAANTLVLRINQSWAQQDEEWLENQLRPKLFEVLVNYAGSPNGGKLVIERLSLAMATFALHSIPTFWPDAIENILQTFTPQNLPVTISPQRVCDILLKILMYIAEEYAVLMPQQDHKAKLNAQMTKSGPLVFRFLHSLLIADNSAVSQDCKQGVLKCLTSWTLHSRTSLLEMDDGRVLLDLLYDSIMDEELCSLACAALAATFSNQKAENYRGAVIEFIPKIAQLKQAIDKYISEEEIECAIKIYSLVINFSENHSRLLLRIVLEDGVDYLFGKAVELKQPIFTIIKTILECTSSPGIYGIDEKYSDLSFTFWFTFFENFYYYNDSFTDLICKTFDPLVDSLLQTLITKAQYPRPTIYYQSWNDDQRESYRCYRQDLGDNISLMVQFPRARERILAQLHEQLSCELSRLLQTASDGERVWQGFESVVFAIKSISESVPFDEKDHVSKIFTMLSQVPYTESHALLYCTVAEMISAFSDWLFTQHTHLAIAFNILFLGVNSSNAQVRLMSTLSLKDLTSECQTVLHPYATKIVESCTNAILQTSITLSTQEKSRLMHTIGTTLAMSPAELVDHSLNSLITPLICELGIKAQGNPSLDPTCRPIILDRLTMLNSLIESLYVKQYSGNDYEGDDENDCRAFDPSRFDALQEAVLDTQPSIGLLKQLIPILSVISSKFSFDEDIMGIISNTIKRSAKSLGLEVKPVLEDLLMIVVNAYDPSLNSNILDGSTPLYMIFRPDQSTHKLFRDAFKRISDKTLQVCMENPLRQLSVTLENYFRFATFVCKKFQEFFTSPTTDLNIEFIYKLAIASLELPEKKTLTEACNFLCQLKHKSIGVDQLHKVLTSHLDVMLCNIFNIFGGNYSTPRNALDSVIDLLFLLTEFDESKGPLKLIVEKENFPTNFVSCEQKARFISRIVHEKNRKKFKDACSEFVLIVRNLNRLV